MQPKARRDAGTKLTTHQAANETLRILKDGTLPSLRISTAFHPSNATLTSLTHNFRTDRAPKCAAFPAA